MRERVDFSFAAHVGLRERQCPPEVWTDLKAVELAVVALDQIPWFEAQFAQRGKTVDAVLMGVSNLGEMVRSVSENCNGRRKNEQMQVWGRGILKIAGNGVDSGSPNGYRQKAAEFVLQNREIFGIAISFAKV